jgi:hypothetical protein
MNQSQFRGLLIVYAVGWLILAAFSGYLGLLLGAEALMSDEALQPQAATARETVLGLLMGLLAFGGTVLAVVAWLGLFVFWKPARYSTQVSKQMCLPRSSYSSSHRGLRRSNQLRRC